jgi:hypothetical protein
MSEWLDDWETSGHKSLALAAMARRRRLGVGGIARDGRALAFK